MDQYEAPNLDDENIGAALHTGLLGEQVSHVTVDQLKSPSSALILQLCVSILQKLDVDTDHMGQHFLQPHLGAPENYQNSTFFAIHVPRYFHRLVPGCTPKRLCTGDLLKPKWGKIRKFLSIVINYFRFLESNSDVFQQINADSEELHKNVQDLEDHNNKVQMALREIDNYMVQNAAVHQEQKKENAEAEHELQQILLKKQEKHQQKEESKQFLETLKVALNRLANENNRVLENIEDVQKLVVTSPEKQVSELKDLNKKLDLVKDDTAVVQDQIQTQQWNIDKKEQIINRLGYALKQLSKFQEFYEKLRHIKSGLMKEQFQTTDDQMNLGCLRQDIDKLKQQKADERDQIHRTKLRGQHQLASQKQRLQEVNRKIELLTSQAHDKDKRIKSLLVAIQQEKEQGDKENELHLHKMKEYYDVKCELMQAAEQTFINANEYIKKYVSSKISDLNCALNE